MFRDPKNSGGGVSTALVNEPSNAGVTVIAGQAKKLSGFSVGGNYIPKNKPSGNVQGTKSMAAGLGEPISTAGNQPDIMHTRTKSQGRQRHLRFNEMVVSGGQPEYNLMGRANLSGDAVSGKISTKNPGAEEHEMIKNRASPNRLANSMDRSTYR